MKGAVSAQKALQGLETETKELLGEPMEKNVLPKVGSLIDLRTNPPQKFKIELVDRPGVLCDLKLEFFSHHRVE